MFIDIDYKKRPQNAKIHLAKPNKTIISNIHEKIKDSVNLKLGDINELEFSIPYYVENNGVLVKNTNISEIREKMLLRLKLGAYTEWYIIEEIEEEGDSEDLLTVKAFSLGYELRYKKTPEFSPDDVYNAEEALKKILSKTIWSIGTIDPMFNQMFRSFDLNTETNVLDALNQAFETFGALVEWDTVNRKVSLKDMKKNGKFRGMKINYGRLLRSIKRNRTADEMVTRLHIEGSEGMSIHSVNPTGQGYIEDFSFFMYPFERDSNKNVLKASNYMSDDLCHAILNQSEAINKYSPQIKKIQDDMLIKEGTMIEKQTQLETLRMELENILSLLDIAKATEDEKLIEEKKREKGQKEAEVQEKQLEVLAVRNQIASDIERINELQDSINDEAGFTKELLDELNVYVIEKDWKDDRYIDPKELYEDGLKEFENIRQPKIVLEVSIDNIMNIIEEQYYWDKLTLGDMIQIKYPQMDIEYMATIIEISYDLENNEASITVANTKELLDDQEKLIQMLYNNSTASTLIENNKYKWDKIYAIEEDVHSIISQEWDANKNKIIAGVNNSIEVGNRGIIIKNPDFPNEVIIMQSGIIALSEDGGENWKTAIRPDGIVGERIIGKIIAGQELIITNGAGSFTMDKNGFRVKGADFVVENSSGDKNLVDNWNKTGDFVEDFRDDNIITHYEKEQLKEQWETYQVQYNFIVELLNGYFDNQGSDIDAVYNFHRYYEDLYRYLFEDSQTDGYPLLDNENMDKSTRIDRVIFKDSWNNYRHSIPEVQKILQIRAKELAQEAKQIAQDAKDMIGEINDDVPWKIEIESSNGLLFKNNNIKTTLTARVYKGSNEVTSEIPKEGFTWKKRHRDGTDDDDWNNANKNIGNVIELTDEDVFQKSTFRCEIYI